MNLQVLGSLGLPSVLDWEMEFGKARTRSLDMKEALGIKKQGLGFRVEG